MRLDDEVSAHSMQEMHEEPSAPTGASSSAGPMQPGREGAAVPESNLQEAAALIALDSLQSPRRARAVEEHHIGSPPPDLSQRAYVADHSGPARPVGALGRLASAVGLSPGRRVDAPSTRSSSYASARRAWRRPIARSRLQAAAGAREAR